jgi:hypothetical protein
MKSSIKTIAAAIGLCFASLVHANPVAVGVMAGGGFGGAYQSANTAQPGVQSSTGAFVNSGLQVQAGDLVSVTATGTMCLSWGTGCYGADGVNYPSFGIGTDHYTALNNVFAALVGAIVANDGGTFRAYDAADVANGIAQSALFKLGSNVQFAAASSGRLYLGVSDSAFWDNDGAGFSVNTSILRAAEVPEPASWALVGLAGLAAFTARRRSR